MKVFKTLLIAFSCFIFSAQAQKNENSAGLELDINSTVKVGVLTSLKPSIRSRFTNFYSSKENGKFFDASGNSRVDIQLLGERTINESTKGAIGVLYRIGELQDAFRIMEQIAWVHNVNAKVNFIHRLKLDQTFRDQNEYRFRYRFGLMTPLKGFNLNKNEKYLLSSFEYLAQMSLGKYSTEMRLKLSIGQLYKNGTKGELGFDIRFDNSKLDTIDYLYILNFSYFFSLTKTRL